MIKALPYIPAILGFTAAWALGLSSSVMILVGGLVGLVCGLLPYFISRGNRTEFAKTSLWVCGVAGMIGGALLAVPTAVVMAIVGYFKSKSASLDATDI
jgi:hypothetical protein